MSIKLQQETVYEQISEWIKDHAKRIKVLSELIVAIPLSRSVQSGDMAANIGRDVQNQSIEQMLRRFYKNEAIDWETHYLPFVRELLKHVEPSVYYLTIDTTEIGGNHRAVVLSLVYQKRALPLVWQVEKGSKGHSRQAVQIKLIKQLAPHLRTEKPVVFLGDSEFCGVKVQRQLRKLEWWYVVRTDPRLYIHPDVDADEAQRIQLRTLVPKAGAAAKQLVDVRFTTEHRDGPVSCFACWEEPHPAPLVVIYHLPHDWSLSVRETYRLRFMTEPLFADCKEAGFRLSQSRLTEAQRLSRLFLATAAAYLWMIGLGTQIILLGWADAVDRSNRRTLSIFKTGWRWFQQQVKLDRIVPFLLSFDFHMALPELKYS